MFLFLCSLTSLSFAAAPKSVDLAANFQPTWGSELASMLSDVLPVVTHQAGYDVSLLVAYDQDTNIIQILIFGSRTTIDSAKTSTDDFRAKGLTPAIRILADTHGVTLNPDQYRITYMSSGKVMLTFEDGKYTVP